jgi:hypothetical protein
MELKIKYVRRCIRRNLAQGNLKKLDVMPPVLADQVKNIKNAA